MHRPPREQLAVSSLRPVCGWSRLLHGQRMLPLQVLSLVNHCVNSCTIYSMKHGLAPTPESGQVEQRESHYRLSQSRGAKALCCPWLTYAGD